MTTVSRVSLASKLLCFSRFDEGESTYSLNLSHTKPNASIVSSSDPIDLSIKSHFSQFTSSRPLYFTISKIVEIAKIQLPFPTYFQEHQAFRCERRISLAYGFASRQGETRNEYSEVISL